MLIETLNKNQIHTFTSSSSSSPSHLLVLGGTAAGAVGSKLSSSGKIGM